MKLYTTLNLLREHGACKYGYEKLLQTVGLNYDKDKPIDLITVLDSNGLFDAIWCLRATTDSAKSVITEFVRYCASRADAASRAADCAASRAAYAASRAAASRAAYAAAYSVAADCAAYAAAYCAADYGAAYAAEIEKQIEKLRELLS